MSVKLTSKVTVREPFEQTLSAAHLLHYWKCNETANNNLIDSGVVCGRMNLSAVNFTGWPRYQLSAVDTDGYGVAGVSALNDGSYYGNFQTLNGNATGTWKYNNVGTTSAVTLEAVVRVRGSMVNGELGNTDYNGGLFGAIAGFGHFLISTNTNTRAATPTRIGFGGYFYANDVNKNNQIATECRGIVSPASAALTLSAWHHVAYVLDPAGTHKIHFFVDGALVGSKEFAAAATRNVDAYAGSAAPSATVSFTLLAEPGRWPNGGNLDVAYAAMWSTNMSGTWVIPPPTLLTISSGGSMTLTSGEFLESSTSAALTSGGNLSAAEFRSW